MTDIRYGDCSTDVEDLQKLLKQKFKYNIKATGEMDDATVKAVADLKGKLGIQNSSKDVSAATLFAIEDAAIPRTVVVINKKTYHVTKAELAQLRSKASAQAEKVMQPYVQMAAEVQSLYDAHDKVRSNNWFWSNVVDAVTKASFPKKAQMKAAVSAATAMQREAKAGILDPSTLSSRAKPIREAMAAMSQYRDHTFGGGAQLVRELTDIQNGATLTLGIAMAVYTGGASWGVQVTGAAAAGSFDQALKEIGNSATFSTRAQHDAAVNRVFVSTVASGAAGVIMKGGKIGKYMDAVTKKAIADGGSGLLRSYILKGVNGGGQKLIEDGITGLPSLNDPKKNFTMTDFVEAGAKSFAEGAALAMLGPVAEKYGGKAGRLFTKDNFGVLGDVTKLDKAGEVLIQQAIDKIGKEVVLKTLAGMSVSKTTGKKNGTEFEPKVRKAILAHPQVRQAYKKATKKK